MLNVVVTLGQHDTNMIIPICHVTPGGQGNYIIVCSMSLWLSVLQKNTPMFMSL
jgi:hypothetical protein